MKFDLSSYEGTEAEKLFLKTAIKYKYEIIRKADPSEDMFQHWDFLIKNKDYEFKVDVKAHKHIYRNGPLLKDWFWIEWKNVRGSDGWINGMADLIAFQYNNYFYLYLRKSLENFARGNVNFNKIVYKSSEAKNCIYTRKDRNDQLSMIKITDLNSVCMPSTWIIS